MTKLSLKIIESFNLEKKTIRPDWDDVGYEFILPSGIRLTGFYMLNNSPCKTDCLEGLDGYIYITKKEELEKLISLSLEQILLNVKAKHPDFKIDDYL